MFSLKNDRKKTYVSIYPGENKLFILKENIGYNEDAKISDFVTAVLEKLPDEITAGDMFSNITNAEGDVYIIDNNKSGTENPRLQRQYKNGGAFETPMYSGGNFKLHKKKDDKMIPVEITFSFAGSEPVEFYF